MCTQGHAGRIRKLIAWIRYTFVVSDIIHKMIKMFICLVLRFRLFMLRGMEIQLGNIAYLPMDILECIHDDPSYTVQAM